MTEGHFLYRLFDADGRLIYVGVTRGIFGRLGAHERTSHWWPDVGDISLTVYGTLKDALRAEKHAIQTENPIFNIAHTKAAAERRKAYAKPPTHRVMVGIPPPIRQRLYVEAEAAGISIPRFLIGLLTTWSEERRARQGRV